MEGRRNLLPAIYNANLERYHWHPNIEEEQEIERENMNNRDEIAANGNVALVEVEADENRNDVHVVIKEEPNNNLNVEFDGILNISDDHSTNGNDAEDLADNSSNQSNEVEDNNFSSNGTTNNIVKTSENLDSNSNTNGFEDDFGTLVYGYESGDDDEQQDDFLSREKINENQDNESNEQSEMNSSVEKSVPENQNVIATLAPAYENSNGNERNNNENDIISNQTSAPASQNENDINDAEKNGRQNTVEENKNENCIPATQNEREIAIGVNNVGSDSLQNKVHENEIASSVKIEKSLVFPNTHEVIEVSDDENDDFNFICEEIASCIESEDEEEALKKEFELLRKAGRLPKMGIIKTKIELNENEPESHGYVPANDRGEFYDLVAGDFPVVEDVSSNRLFKNM